MDNINTTFKKIEKYLKFLKSEYDLLMKNFTEENILNRSIPIRPTNIATKEQKESINKLLNHIFLPVLKTVSKMIDESVVEWSDAADSFNLKELKIENEQEILFNDSLDRLYILKKEKYDFEMLFIQESYLFFFQEIQKSNDPIFIDIAKKIKKQEIVDSRIQKIIIYKNIINVFKHGDGKSFNWIRNNVPDITYDNANGDTFSFDLDKVNFYDCYSSIMSLLKELISN